MLWRKKSEFTVSAKEKCIDQSASYDRSAVACGSFGVCCGLSGIRKYHLSFLWFDREVLPGTLLLAAVIAAYFQLIYTISGESTRGTIVLLAVNVFQIMASGVVIPTAYLPELFGKSEPFFH